MTITTTTSRRTTRSNEKKQIETVANDPMSRRADERTSRRADEPTTHDGIGQGGVAIPRRSVVSVDTICVNASMRLGAPTIDNINDNQPLTTATRTTTTTTK